MEVVSFGRWVDKCYIITMCVVIMQAFEEIQFTVT